MRDGYSDKRTTKFSSSILNIYSRITFHFVESQKNNTPADAENIIHIYGTLIMSKWIQNKFQLFSFFFFFSLLPLLCQFFFYIISFFLIFVLHPMSCFDEHLWAHCFFFFWAQTVLYQFRINKSAQDKLLTMKIQKKNKIKYCLRRRKNNARQFVYQFYHFQISI